MGWGRRRRRSKPEKLDTFLESMEKYEEGMDVEHEVAKMLGDGKSVDEIVEYFDDKNVDADHLGAAIVNASKSLKEGSVASDAAMETNKKVQGTEDNEEEPVEDEPMDEPEGEEDLGDLEEPDGEDAPEDKEDVEELTESNKEAKEQLVSFLKKVEDVLGFKDDDITGRAERKPSLMDKLIAAMAEISGPVIDEEKDEYQYSEADFVVNLSDKLAEELDEDSTKIREMVAAEMKQYKESDPNFNEAEFSNIVENCALKTKSKKK
jgi:hypothetical protein